jgi:glutamyl-Q tRNA(Asp) synthetase
MIVTRFAPSPTGYLHLGHAASALFAHDLARRAGGRFLLRIEDIDAARCRPEYEAAILEDLAWLGLAWDGAVRRQSDHLADYQAALDRLVRLGVVYPCFCSRKEIAAEIAAAGAAPHGPDGPVYPGTCRARGVGAASGNGRPYALRLDVAAGMAIAGPLAWRDMREGLIEAQPQRFGDPVIARRDAPTSYHLAVTVDDHLQGVTLVTRGDDLFEATHIHRLLQALLGYATPEYQHHKLLLGPDGKRLSKRDGATEIRALREGGHSAAKVREMGG